MMSEDHVGGLAERQPRFIHVEDSLRMLFQVQLRQCVSKALTEPVIEDNLACYMYFCPYHPGVAMVCNKSA